MFLCGIYAWQSGWIFYFPPYFTKTKLCYILVQKVMWHGMAWLNIMHKKQHFGLYCTVSVPLDKRLLEVVCETQKVILAL